MRVLGMIMAGGKGERLYPLTKERSKPAVPFGGKYRIVDFVLSNFVNSGIFSSYVLVQYLSQSLIEYLRTSWRTEGLIPDHFLTTVPPQMRMGEIWYRGTADAVRQNINLVKKPPLSAYWARTTIIVSFSLTKNPKIRARFPAIPMQLLPLWVTTFLMRMFCCRYCKNASAMCLL